MKYDFHTLYGLFGVLVFMSKNITLKKTKQISSL